MSIKKKRNSTPYVPGHCFSNCELFGTPEIKLQLEPQAFCFVLVDKNFATEAHSYLSIFGEGVVSIKV